MREIKFRAWDKRHNQWFHKFLIIVTNDGFYENHRAFEDGNNLLDDEYALMQYTGLKDRNGKEIYEGDIVQGSHGKKYVIKWGINSNGFIAQTNEVHGNVYSSYHLAPKTEVISNIYENPELLK